MCLLLLVIHYSAHPQSAIGKSVKDNVFELNPRGGLPHFFEKASQGGPLKVAYLGGSITAQNGWRVYSFDWLKERFPKAKFTEVNAAIGGTGSDFGVFRLRDHMLKFNPDLVFIEFAVNDSKTPPEKIIRSMEGIVRQIWQQNPVADICFIYTIKSTFLESEQNGQLPESVVTMETIADRYQIPTINFGFEVAKLISSNQLLFKGESKSLNGVKVFSPDGVHPYFETGHVIYQNVLKRSFESMLKSMVANNQGHVENHNLPQPLAADYFANTQMIDIKHAKLSRHWKIFRIGNEPSFSGFEKYLNKVGKASRSGETLTIRFRGRTIGALDFIGPDVGRVIVEIDGAVKDTVFRFNPWCTSNSRMMHYFLIDHLEEKEHDVVFRILAEPFDKAAILAKIGNKIKNPDDFEENNWYVGKILIDGKLLSR
jgi:hypothetical protein